MTMVVPGKPAMLAEGRSREMTSQKTGNGDKREGSDDVVVKLVDIAGQLGQAARDPEAGGADGAVPGFPVSAGALLGLAIASRVMGWSVFGSSVAG